MIHLNSYYKTMPVSFHTGSPVVGKAIFVHPQGRFVTLEYQIADGIVRESFFPSQLEGREVYQNGTLKNNPFKKLRFYDEEKLNALFKALDESSSVQKMEIPDLEYLLSFVWNHIEVTGELSEKRLDGLEECTARYHALLAEAAETQASKAPALKAA